MKNDHLKPINIRSLKFEDKNYSTNHSNLNSFKPIQLDETFVSNFLDTCNKKEIIITPLSYRKRYFLCKINSHYISLELKSSEKTLNYLFNYKKGILTLNQNQVDSDFIHSFLKRIEDIIKLIKEKKVHLS